MAGFNAGLPTVYQFLGEFEQFSEGTRHVLTVSRSMITRIAGFFFFVYSTMETGNHIACWENHIGQALYSLMLTTTIIEWASSSYVDAAMHYLPSMPCGIAKLGLKFGLEGKDPFDFKKHMNELLYTQLIVTFGTFYCPILPVMGAIRFFVVL